MNFSPAKCNLGYGILVVFKGNTIYEIIQTSSSFVIDFACQEKTSRGEKKRLTILTSKNFTRKKNTIKLCNKFNYFTRELHHFIGSTQLAIEIHRKLIQLLKMFSKNDSITYSVYFIVRFLSIP